MMKDERKAIERFIAQNGFEITTKDTLKMLEDKVYFKTKEGLYIHVIDSGNGNKAKNNQEVTVRYRNLIYISRKDTIKSNEAAEVPPITFNYNNSYTYGKDDEGLSCHGLSIGLSFVRNNAKVSLIIPSELQSSDRQNLYMPLYFEYLRYRY